MSQSWFYKKMRIVCMAIPQGQVATYGQIAMLCGKPGNARQVGYGLRENLAGNVPAFRVVNSKGQLSGASHFLLPGLQKALLEEEGIEVLWDGATWRVDLHTYGWKTTKEDLDRLQAQFTGLPHENDA